MSFDTYTDDEIKRWLWLRAIEWGAFPAFLSQPVAPILFIFSPWYFVVLGVVALGLIWRFVRYSFVSVRVAGAVVVPIVWLKWPASIGSGIYLFIHHQPAAGVLALVWPFVAGWIGAATSFPTYVGTIELAFAKKIGYVSPDAEL
ncbi:MAG TPA: hypothetical protein VIK28_10475 [Sedimentisphaerales bacterium]